MITKNLFNISPWYYRNPFDELDRIQRLLSTKPSAGVFPLINVTEDKSNFYVRAELPGIKADELEITVTGESLAISGEREIASEGEHVKYHRRERESGKFSRMFNLPTVIDSNKVDATFANGILTIVLPKAEAAKPKQITVK
ncbi:MAG: Hsp20/alpha crystallin family protein [Desulfobacterales bacterium]|nr:Hsp20/alpha crystallin family protein [Desulfobacterales bacterium]